MKKAWYGALAALGAACGASQAEMDSVTAERDSLVAEVMANAAVINRINAELGALSDTSSGMAIATEQGLSEAARENEIVLDRIRLAITRLNESEAEIQRNRERLRQLSSTESRLLSQIAEYEATIADLRETAERREAQYTAIISQQRSMIASLARRLDTAQATNLALSRENEALGDTVAALTDLSNTVYYIVGTQDELTERGVAVLEGSKFLFFGSRRLEPSRDLDPVDFVAIDKTQVLEIALPDPERTYRILTRHNPVHLTSPVDEDGRIQGSLVIGAPDEFWAPSRFLIIVAN